MPKVIGMNQKAQKGMIEQLESVIERIKSGEIIGLAYVITDNDGIAHWGHDFANNQRTLLIGGLYRLTTQLCDVKCECEGE
jgi:hypothetical protein